MKQIRIHGRGGQGVVAMAEVLAIAFFNDGQISQAFPHFGVERSGAPIQSFVRVSPEEIKTREHVYHPDILIILDDSLISKADVFFGIKKDSIIIINSKLKPSDISKLISGSFSEKNVFSIDASSVALEVFGRNITNTVILGALTKIPGLLSSEAMVRAIKEKFSYKGSETVNKNILAVRKIIKKDFNK